MCVWNESPVSTLCITQRESWKSFRAAESCSSIRGIHFLDTPCQRKIIHLVLVAVTPLHAGVDYSTLIYSEQQH